MSAIYHSIYHSTNVHKFLPAWRILYLLQIQITIELLPSCIQIQRNRSVYWVVQNWVFCSRIVLKKFKVWANKNRYVYTDGEIIISKFFSEYISDLYQKERFKELKEESDFQSFLTPPPIGTEFNCLDRRKDSAIPNKRGN